MDSPQHYGTSRTRGARGTEIDGIDDLKNSRSAHYDDNSGHDIDDDNSGHDDYHDTKGHGDDGHDDNDVT